MQPGGDAESLLEIAAELVTSTSEVFHVIPWFFRLSSGGQRLLEGLGGGAPQHSWGLGGRAPRIKTEIQFFIGLQFTSSLKMVPAAT